MGSQRCNVISCSRENARVNFWHCAREKVEKGCWGNDEENVA